MASSTRSVKTVPEVIKPNKRGAAYFLSLSDPVQLSARDYFKSRINKDSTTKPYTICREWNNWIEALKECNSNQWRLAAEQAPKVTAAIVKEWSKAEPIQEASGPLTSVNEQSHGSSSSVTELSHTSQSSTSSSTLSSGALDNMKSEFSTNFHAFQGSP
ncbi:hypothetical protein BGZ49_010624, partial [Haplosporangium sp. Z 27]